MIATLVEFPLDYPKGDPRSEGVHVSTLIKNLAIGAGILKSEQAIEELGLRELSGDGWWTSLDDNVQLRIAIGLAWEQWYLPQLEDVVDHPGEMHIDGIYMTPDGESIDYVYGTYLNVLHEVKATYKSTRTVGDLTSQWMWMTQCKAYCKGANTRICYVHVLFLCGDYMRPITPQLKIWRVEFTQDEIDVSWNELLDYMRHCQES